MPQDRGGVGDRFLVPELGSGRVEVGHVRALVVGGDLERRTGPGRGPTLPAAMPGLALHHRDHIVPDERHTPSDQNPQP